MSLDCRELCNADLADLPAKLFAAAKQHGPDQLTEQLLEALESDLIPSSVVSVWLDAAKDTSRIIRLLACTSRFVRADAIKRARIWLQGSRWKEMWMALGGVRGLVDLFARSSFHEVKLLVHMLRKSVPTGSGDEDERRPLLTSLLKCLLPSVFPDASYPSNDGRRLQRVYIRILPVCTTEFVLYNFESGLSKSPWADLISKDSMIPWQHFVGIQSFILSRLSDGSNLCEIARKFLPVLTETSPGFSRRSGWTPSMEFSLRVLKVLPVAKQDQVKDWNVTNMLVNSLLHRLAKNRAAPSDMLEVVLATIAYANVDRELVTNLAAGPNRSNFAAYVVRMWTRAPEKCEKVLIDVLELLRPESPLMDHGWDLVKEVPERHRYRLLKLMWRFALNIRTNIDDPLSLQTFVAKGGAEHLSVSIFLGLDSVEALDLLDKLTAATGPKNLRIWTWSDFPEALKEPGSYSSSCADTQFLRVYLRQPTPELSADTQAIIDDLRIKAAKARDPHQRNSYACAVMVYSLASRDLTIYESCLKWSQRFLRDHIPSMSLFTNFNGYMDPRPLLSGVQDYQSSDVLELKDSIFHANGILRLWIQIACDAIREPHLTDRSWNHLTRLLSDVVGRRVKMAAGIRERLQIDQDALYNAIFDDTVILLTHAQDIGLESEYIKLALLQGPLLQGASILDGKEPATWRFFDALAKTRDALWAHARMRLNPEVVSLPPIWPQGLPIQYHLGSADLSDKLSGADLPYLEDRAKKLVFASATDLCTPFPDKETLKVISTFRDSYQTALKFYVFAARDAKTRKSRVEKAWKHATIELCQDLDSAEWKSRRWTDLYSSLGVFSRTQKSSVGRIERYPVLLPEYDDQITEWNPATARPERRGTQERQAYIIDMLLSHVISWAPSGWLLGKSFGESAAASSASLPCSAEAPKDIFDVDRHILRSTKELEGRIACAMLWLDLTKGGSESIMSKGFPQNTKGERGLRRFPPLLLDPDFQSKEDPSTVEVFNFLSKVQRRVPLQLLMKVATETLKAFNGLAVYSPLIVRIEEILLSTLKFIGRDPHAAALVCDALLELPDSSSWHRQIMRPRMLNNLSPDMAINLLRRFITRSIELVEKRKSGAKATSIKMVARLLSNTSIFSASTSVDLLSDILTHYSHPDVRLAAFQSLGDILTSTSGAALDTETSLVAEDLIISIRPTIAALDERWGSDKVWEEWDVDKDLPSIDDDQILFRLLLGWCSNDSMPEHFRHLIATKVVIPAVGDNISNHKLWLQRFQQKYAPQWELDSWPISTTQSSMLRDVVLQLYKVAPHELIVQWQAWTLRTAENREVRDLDFGIDISVVKNEDLRYWTAAFTPTSSAFDEALEIFKLLEQPWDWEAPANGIRLEHVQDCVKALLEHDLDHLTNKDYTEAGIAQRPWRYEDLMPKTVQDDHLAWHSHCRPIVQWLIAAIDQRRSPSWQRETARKPVWLPDTFQLRSFLWRLPGSKGWSVDALVEDALADLRVVTARRVVWATQLEIARSTIDELCTVEQQREVALRLGDLGTSEGGDQREMVVRVKLAAGLLDPSMEGGRDMAERWLRTDCEEIWESAWTMLSRSDNGSQLEQSAW